MNLLPEAKVWGGKGQGSWVYGSATTCPPSPLHFTSLPTPPLAQVDGFSASEWLDAVRQVHADWRLVAASGAEGR